MFILDKSWKLGLIVAFVFLVFSTLFSFQIFAQSNVSCIPGYTDEPFNKVTETFSGRRAIPCLTESPSQRNFLGYNSYQKDDGTGTGTSGTSYLDEPHFSTYFKAGGATSAMMSAVGNVYDNMPSTKDAVVYQAEKAGLTAKAQVQGFNQFAPIATLWGVFRNIALLLFVVVFVAIGFFILIQRKMGGQETVSLVSGIINAAVAMVVIAFSYAIGGIIVDIFSNVMNGVVATTFNGFVNSQDVLAQLNTVNSGVNVLTIISEFQNFGVSSSGANLFSTALSGLSYPVNSVKRVFSNLQLGETFPVIGAPAGGILGFFANTFVDILTGIITTGFNNSSLITAIVSFVIFVVMLRIVFALLGAYVSIVFKIMFAPFILLPAALPGNAGKVIMGWVLGLIAHALVFPAIFACILMSAMFLNLNANLTEGNINECKYVSQLNPGNTSTIPGNTVKAKIFVVTRLGRNEGDGYTQEQTSCYPLVLPPKFNFWPAPFGYLQGVEPDDLIRFVIALAFIVMTPAIPKLLQQVLRLPQDNLMGSVSSGFRSGANAFGSFISSVPSFGVGKAIGSVAKSVADNAQ